MKPHFLRHRPARRAERLFILTCLVGLCVAKAFALV